MRSWPDSCFPVQAPLSAWSLIQPYHPFPRPPQISLPSFRAIAFVDIVPSAENSDPDFCLVNMDFSLKAADKAQMRDGVSLEGWRRTEGKSPVWHKFGKESRPDWPVHEM